MSRIGEAIRRRRMYLCLSQAELARRAGVKPPVISNIERGERRSMSLKTLVRLADTLGWNDTQLGAMCRAIPADSGSSHA